MAKNPTTNDTLGLPDAVYEELQRLRDLIRSDTVKRELWGNRFTAADRRKFAGPVQEVLERHHTIELWNIARGTPTPNQCIVEVAYAVGPQHRDDPAGLRGGRMAAADRRPARPQIERRNAAAGYEQP